METQILCTCNICDQYIWWSWLLLKKEVSKHVCGKYQEKLTAMVEEYMIEQTGVYKSSLNLSGGWFSWGSVLFVYQLIFTVGVTCPVILVVFVSDDLDIRQVVSVLVGLLPLCAFVMSSPVHSLMLFVHLFCLPGLLFVLINWLVWRSPKI